jgi:capsular polysaccharide transport system permease protein
MPWPLSYRMQVQSLHVTSRKRSPLQIQRAVLLALVLRDLRGRVKGNWLSLIWMLFEPLAFAMLMVTALTLRSHLVALNVELPVFLVTGLLPFLIFRNLTRRLPTAVSSSRNLLAYRQVKPIDALIARAIVEALLFSAVYLSAISVLGWVGYHWVPHEPLELIVVSTLILLLAIGLGLVFTVLAHGRPRVQLMIDLAFYPLYFVSGVIIPLHNVPSQILQWLLLNPVLHLIELSRLYFIDSYQPVEGVNMHYPAFFTLVVMTLGLSMYRVYRHRLAATS